MANFDNNFINDASSFKNIVNTIVDVLIAVELDGTVSYINSRIYDLLGYRPEEFIGLNIFHFVHPEDFPRFSQEIKRSRKLKINLSIEYRLKHKKGQYVPVHGRGNFYQSKGTIRVITVISDITERKKYEEELNKFKFIVESAHDAIFFKDLESRYITANNKALEAFGLTRKEVIGKNDLELMSDEKEAIKNIEDDQTVFKTGKLKEITKKMTGKDGKALWFNAIKVPHFDNDGNLIGLVGIARNISEQKKAELKLIASEKKHRHLFENSPHSIILLNSKGIILDCNSRLLEKFLGYKKDEILRKHFKEVFKMPQKAFSIAIESFKSLIMGAITKPIEIQSYTKDDKLIWVHLQASLLDLNGETIVQVIAQNISERKLAEEKLKESEKKNREAYNRAELYKDLFAHDMNNILQNILLGIQVSRVYLDKKKELEDFRKFLNIMQTEVIRGASLASNIRKLSQLQEITFSLEPTDVNDILKKSINKINIPQFERKIDITVDNPYKKVFIKANELLDDVFENILNNVMRYNKNPIVKIHIKISKEQKKSKDYIKMEFLDNGIGIEESRKSLIFLRAESKNKSIRGMGLGLSLVKKIVNLYNGQITVEDRVKGDYTKGSNFILLFPGVVN